MPHQCPCGREVSTWILYTSDLSSIPWAFFLFLFFLPHSKETPEPPVQHRRNPNTPETPCQGRARRSCSSDVIFQFVVPDQLKRNCSTCRARVWNLICQYPSAVLVDFQSLLCIGHSHHPSKWLFNLSITRPPASAPALPHASTLVACI